MSDRALLEPGKYYEAQLKDQFKNSAESYFDELVTGSKINADENRAVSAKYRKIRADADAKKKTLNVKKFLRTLFIVLGILFIVAGIVTVYRAGTLGAEAYVIAIGVSVAVLGAAGIAFSLLVLNKAVKKAQEDYDKRQKEADAEYDRAKAIIAPLLSAFDGDITRKLIMKAAPIITVDKNFSMKRFDYMRQKYGFSDNDDETESTLNLLSGEIAGNPFVFERRLKMRMGTKTYTGTRIITYTVTTTDSKGNRHTHTVSQTLVAHVTKPMPYYDAKTRVVYGNDAAPDLSFSREPHHVERLNEKELERFVKKQSAKARKKTERSTVGSGGFTAMGDDKFEALFGAFDRDNEVQFRLLFTVLARKNVIDLLRDKKNYGDDFQFKKRGCLNFIRSEHSENWDMSTSPENYYSYDVDIVKKKFLSFNENFFRSMFFDLAPVLSIPLYQQQEPKEYIYGGVFNRNLTSYESEALANSIGTGVFAHSATNSGVILKTALMNKLGKSDRVKVKALSYRTEQRCDTVMVFGGDGRMHGVPVFWDEYIPIVKYTTMDLKELGYGDSEARPDPSVAETIKKGLTSAFSHGIFACVGGGDDLDLDKIFIL